MYKPSVISFFSGIGGIDLAFKNAGFELLLANEIDCYACTTYKNNFSDSRLIQNDIKNINTQQLPQADVLIAGFPCQSFSVMGYKKGFNDYRGNLFFQIIKIAKDISPNVIFLENVKNLLYHDNGRTFDVIYRSLVNIGYFVRYDIQSPHTHGNIPQERNRTFIVAFKNNIKAMNFTFPSAKPLEKSLNDIIDRSIIHDQSYYYKESSSYYQTLNEKITDTNGIYRIDDSGVATKKYIISPTLKANMGTYHDRVPIIRDNFGIRKITPYECLALQGFPKDFIFKNIPIEAAYKQCGNTVCVPVVQEIAKNIYTTLRG